MRLAEARRLKPGDRVLVESRYGCEDEAGTVVHATRKGGVLVKIGGASGWFPYHRVHHEEGLMRKVSALLG